MWRGRCLWSLTRGRGRRRCKGRDTTRYLPARPALFGRSGGMTIHSATIADGSPFGAAIMGLGSRRGRNFDTADDDRNMAHMNGWGHVHASLLTPPSKDERPLV